MIDLFLSELKIFFTSSILAVIIFSSLIFIQCGSRKQNEGRLSESRRDATTTNVVVAIGGGPGGAIQRDQESTGDNKEKSILQHSKIGKSKRLKELKSPHQQKTRTETPHKTERSEMAKKSEAKTKQSDRKGKFGDTINDDTLNDADCDWLGGDVEYKADRTKKKKRKH
uniref:Uncharacterized protein n=1 Tax=Panagrolaimus sp. PS1159 TaxID=55785 RepID=A0AC35FRY0_9BILA